MERSATYWRAVTRIKNAAERRDRADAWRIGDHTLSVCPVGQSGIANRTKATLELLSEDTGVPYNTLRDARRVSDRWPRDERSSLHSWAVHRQLARRDDRFERMNALAPGVSERQVRESLPKPEQSDESGAPKELGRPNDPLRALAVGLEAWEIAVDRLALTALDNDERHTITQLVERANTLLERAARYASQT